MLKKRKNDYGPVIFYAVVSLLVALAVYTFVTNPCYA